MNPITEKIPTSDPGDPGPAAAGLSPFAGKIAGTPPATADRAARDADDAANDGSAREPARAPENHVSLSGVRKSFGNFVAADSVSFGLPKGTLGALLGPSGSGKTTILRMIAGLENPDRGDILIDGARVNDVHPSKRGIGFVFQNYALFRYMTVFDNIAFGLRAQKADRNRIRERVNELLTLTDMNGLEKRYPAQLSGGQRQRVAFARALAPSPRLLLLDEPFAAIDAKVRRELRSWLRAMITKLGITSIFVTHDQDEAIEVADLVIITNRGRVEQTGTPLDLYREPATPFVARFVGESTVLEDYGRLLGFENAPRGAKASVRPEFVHVCPPGDPVQYENSAENAEVLSVAFRGSSLEVKVGLKGFVLTTGYSLEHPALSVGEKVKILVWRVYAFEDDKARLVNNSRLESRGNGYNFAI
ncbi:MAG: ATP-binding cassette domain-containing protein [Deltaproteobacteria bacterium]|jgi:sulfate transport system ATP-binding protein|nr:ATP-binding cassette domain-containing protein [Deltaproteobacteria bacterium]